MAEAMIHFLASASPEELAVWAVSTSPNERAAIRAYISACSVQAPDETDVGDDGGDADKNNAVAEEMNQFEQSCIDYSIQGPGPPPEVRNVHRSSVQRVVAASIQT